jgi:bifunctional UDP-N-acetylglucosamine pyrophosphorylase/glucosamine-1-phosphate N-acetyltransferase
VQLAELERVYQQRETEALMRAGATLLDPDRVDIRGDLRVGQDCIIDINVVFEGRVTLGENVQIGPGCVIKDSSIDAGTIVNAHTVIEGARIGRRCSLGPFARIRPGSEFAEDVKIGNFVETKKTRIGAGTKAGHLAYLGDAEVGSETNIGAGTVTCNYDGVNKHRTEIGDDVFIGTNATLVAPISIETGAFVAAGSTVTTDIKPGDLAVGRARQRNIKGWIRPDKR